MSEIKANATSDFEDVFAVIKRLPQGATVREQDRGIEQISFDV